MDALNKLQALLGDQVVTDRDILEEVSTDFGGLIQKQPRAVVIPQSATDLSQILQVATEDRWPVSTRGSAHSQSGQSLTQNGFLLDMTGLNKIGKAGNDSVWVDSGVTWGDLVKELMPLGLIPPVLTNNLNVTIGGTLSMAGLGVASHRYGTQADNVEALEVVTGAGDLVTCSATENQDLFDCSRCGLGQFSVITRAKIKLRRFKPRVRTYYLLYDSIEALMTDQTRVLSDLRFDFVEGWCSPCPQGLRKMGETKVPFAQWFYPAHLTIEYDKLPPSDSEIADLHFYKKVYQEDSNLNDFVFRLEPLFQLWREGGTWKYPHPWMEVILPWDSAAGYIEGVLTNFPPNLLAGGHVLLWPCRGTTTKVPLFMHPPGDLVMGFGILPAIPKHSVRMAVPLLNRASELAIQVGGKRYLSGLVEFDHSKWKDHYGDKWSQILQWKSFFDPNGILNPGFIHYSEE